MEIKMRSTKHKKIILILVGLLAVNLAVLGFLSFQRYGGDRNVNLEVIFFDVGQGDSIFIRTPENQKILIDGGPDASVVYKLGRYLPFFDRKIDLIILTHPHPDHLTGLIEVLKRYQVKYVLYNGIFCDTPLCAEFFRMINEKDVFLKRAAAGQVVYLNDDLRLNILHPLDGSVYGEDDLNNSSLTAKLIFNDTSFLLTGDIEEKVDKELIENNADLEADVLKVAHHGSDTSTSEDFLNQVNPRFAVISVGENKFGHPSRRVLNRLERAGVKIFRTDEKEDIKFTSDGKSIWLAGENNCQKDIFCYTED